MPGLRKLGTNAAGSVLVAGLAAVTFLGGAYAEKKDLLPTSKLSALVMSIRRLGTILSMGRIDGFPRSYPGKLHLQQ